MNTFLTALSGIAWTVVYIEAIRIGFRQRTYAMPVLALALNFSWETIYAFHGLATDANLQAFVNLIWACGDIVIVYTFFRFGRRELAKLVTRPLFIAWGVGVFAIAFVVQALFVVQFGWTQAPAFSAFLQNALMSGLFIAMFVARRGARGQSLVIAIAKCLGTLAPTILVGVLRGSVFITGLGIICLVLDLAYIGLILWARTKPAVLEAVPASRAKVLA